MKPRILFVNESSALNTGYSTYGREILSRLHKSGKYDIAELATYILPYDSRLQGTPWKVYTNMDASLDQMNPNFNTDRYNAYKSNPINEFGEWAIDSVLLDFKPTSVFTIRDFWMDSFIPLHPLKRYFNFTWMATADAAPQNPEWLDVYARCDNVLAYNDWSLRVLREQSGGKLNLRGSAPSAAPPDFFPLSDEQRAKNKEELGFGGYTIIGTVMRNQKRKLYPDLFKLFKSILSWCKKTKVLLYCHTTYPDMGWDIPRLLIEHEIGQYVIFSYKCRNPQCKAEYPQRFVDGLDFCKVCGQKSMEMISVNNGYDNKTMNVTYNLFDLYIQYSNCLPKGEKVLLDRGWANIEDVKIGDIAYTHKGRYRKVLNTFKHQNNNDMYEFKVYSDFETLKCTAEHPILCLSQDIMPPQKRSFREWVGQEIKRKDRKFEPEFVEAKNVKVGDLLAYKINEEVVDVDKIDLVDYIETEGYIIDEKSYRYRTSSVDHDRYLIVDDLFCRWLGLYGANGNVTNTATQGVIKITSNIKNKSHHKLCNDIMQRFGNAYSSEYDDREAVDYLVHNKVLSTIFKKECGKRTNKRLPSWYVRLPISKQKEILRGLCMGDGCYTENDNITTYCTTSYILHSQVKELCKRIGLNYNCSTRQKEGNRKLQYLFEIRGNIKEGEFCQKRQSTRGVINNGYYFVQVKEASVIDYDGEVYNFEVEEDNSYCSMISHIHNSEGMGMPPVEAAACNVPVMEVDYSAMSDVVRKLGGVPIKVKELQLEIETGCYRAIPDLMSTRKHIEYFLKGYKKQNTRAGFEKHYSSWDKTAAIWENVFDSIDHKMYDELWRQPVTMNAPAEYPQGNIPTYEFVKFLFTNVLHEPHLIGTYHFNRMVRDLNYGSTGATHNGNYFNESSLEFSGHKKVPFDRQQAYNHMRHLWDKRYYLENARLGTTS